MEMLREAVSGICLVAGSCFAVIGGIGVLRLPDFYTRLHGGGITDTLGAGLILVGLMFQSESPFTTVKLLMILAFLLTCSPTSCHALAQSAVTEGLQPLLAQKKDD
jgi:multicomponent Na+:H+ antiporter subunit G